MKTCTRCPGARSAPYRCSRKDSDELAAQVLDGLAGNRPRNYGLPFLGNNSFLPDRIEAVE